MNIECFVVGELEENCYLLTDGESAVLIDPGAESERLLAAVEKSGCTLEKILLTHGHFDHIGAVCALAKKSGAKVFVHSKDAPMLTDNSKNLSYMANGIEYYEPDGFLDETESIQVGNTALKVFYTPGHSDGSVCFLCENVLLSGDLLFQGSIGRFDHGNLREELKSLKFLMDNFDDSVKVLPGHGPSTTIGEERAFNPYIVKHVIRMKTDEHNNERA